MAQLLFPNIAGATLQGFQQGQQMRANRLVGAAMQNPDDAQGYLAQAGAIDPRLALGVQGAMQQQQAQQQAAQQSQQTTTLKQIGGAARYYKAALQSGNPASVQAAKAQIAPLIMRLTGKQLPDSDTPETQAALDNVIAQTAYLFPGDLKQESPISVGPDTTLIDPRTHQVIYQGQGDAGTAVTGMTYNGMPVFRDKFGNLKDVRGNPIPQGGGNGVGMGQAGAGALAGLPAETQAYVPKVNAALNGQPAFDQFGQPTGALLDAVQQVESGGNPNAVSPAGAQGPYQFMPATAASVGVTDPFDPQEARQGAAKYLAQLYQQFGGDANKAIAAYNAGPGRVASATGPAHTPSQAGLQYTPTRGNATDVIAQRAQQIQELKARGVAMTPADEQAYLTTGKVGSGFNANSPAPIGDTSLKGPARLASIDPNDRATVLAVLQGRKAPPTGTASKSSYWMGIIQAANAIDPTFDETSWPARVKTAQAYAPSGPQGQQIIALNTLVNHVGELADQFKSLHNTGSPMYNTAANYLAYQTGLGAEGLPAYNINAHAAAQEIETLWKKGGGNEADIKRYSDALSSSNSPAQQQQVIQKMLKLAYGRLQSLQSNYQNSMGIAGHGLNFVNDKSEAVIQSLAPNLADEYQQGSTALPSGQIAAAQQPLQPQTAPSGPAPGTIEQGYRFKGGDPSNQANWEPVQ